MLRICGEQNKSEDFQNRSTTGLFWASNPPKTMDGITQVAAMLRLPSTLHKCGTQVQPPVSSCCDLPWGVFFSWPGTGVNVTKPPFEWWSWRPLAWKKLVDHLKKLVGSWTNPSEKYAPQNGLIFPRGENTKHLKPPSSYELVQDFHEQYHPLWTGSAIDGIMRLPQNSQQLVTLLCRSKTIVLSMGNRQFLPK